MNAKFKLQSTQSVIRVLAASAVLLCAVTATAMAEPGWREHDKPASHEQMHEHFREHIKARLDKLAFRLEIKASQEPAWDAYAHAVESMADHPDRKTGMKEDEEDAAALLHRRAERAAEKAKKLAGVADAMDKLQAVLNENQRKLLNREMLRHMGHMGHDGDECQEHDGHGHEWRHTEADR